MRIPNLWIKKREPLFRVLPDISRWCSLPVSKRSAGTCCIPPIEVRTSTAGCVSSSGIDSELRWWFRCSDDKAWPNRLWCMTEAWMFAWVLIYDFWLIKDTTFSWVYLIDLQLILDKSRHFSTSLDHPLQMPTMGDWVHRIFVFVNRLAL